MNQVLTDCAAIEENVAKIYRMMAANSEVSEELRGILHKMAADEDQHAEKIRFAQRLNREKVFDESRLPHQRVKELLADTHSMLARLAKEPFGEHEALMTMIRLERDFCQVHVEAVAQFKDPSLLKLFESLAGDDASHRETLDNYLNKVKKES